METRIGGTAMTSLLGHGETNGTSPLFCTLERGRAELQDDRMRGRDAVPCIAVWVPRSGCEMRGSGFAGHWIYGIARKQGVCMAQRRVSPDQFLTCSVTASGPLRRPAANSLFCFAVAPCGLRFPSAMDPPQMQSFGLGSRALSLGFARCDPSRSGIQNQETRKCT
jgi:hypothetical protein